MAKTLFTLASLHKIGGLAENFDELVRMCVKDCTQRPSVGKKREVKLIVSCVPDEANHENVMVSIESTCKVPNKAADKYRMTSTINGGLKFQPNSPYDPDQDSLLDDGPEE